MKKRIAILVTNGFEESELSSPKQAMEAEGFINPDKLRRNEDALMFVRDFFDQHKPVAAICHAPWIHLSADVVKGRKMTSFASIKDDLVNAGANWLDEEVVCENGFVTSRDPDDLPAFNSKLIEEIKEGKHELQGV